MNYRNQRNCQGCAARLGCTHGNNTWRTPRADACACGTNTWRTPRADDCACGVNTWRTPRVNGCACEADARHPQRVNDCACKDTSARNLSGNAGTVWKNRNGCGCLETTLNAVRETADCPCNRSATPRTACCNDTPCAVGASEDCALSGRSLAMVYSPHQKFQSLYDPREGLCRGTVFCELDKPFHGTGRSGK